MSDRDDRKREVAGLLLKGMDRAHHQGQGWTQESLGRHLGTARKGVRHWLDPEGISSIPFADVLALPVIIREMFARRLAKECGAYLTELPEAEALADDLRRVSHQQIDFAAVISAELEALADGIITVEEAKPLLAKIEQALVDLVTLRARAQQVVKHGVQGVRRAG